MYIHDFKVFTVQKVILKRPPTIFHLDFSHC